MILIRIKNTYKKNKTTIRQHVPPELRGGVVAKLCEIMELSFSWWRGRVCRGCGPPEGRSARAFAPGSLQLGK